MANFTFNATLSISTDDGIQIDKTVTGVAANAKHLLDDEFDPTTVVDFAPLIATITDPTWFILVLDGDGAKLKFDSIAGFTAKAYKTFLAALSANTPGPSGVLDLEIETSGAKQRVEFLVVGNE